ncbi:MAG: ABC transporter substrate-binding protein [Clostridia bacterium]
MRRTLALSMMALVAIASLPAQGYGFTDARGKAVVLPVKAKRIVSLSPAATEILYAAGAGKAMVGATTYCYYPAEANDLAKIGGYSARTISIEAIVALRPDLVIGELSMHSQLAAQLESSGIAFAGITLTTFDDIYTAMTSFARAGGDEQASAAAVASMKARVEAVRSRIAAIPTNKRPTVFWEVWNEPLMTAGPSTFISMILTAAGARNVFADINEDWPVISFEAIVARNPDWIMAAETHAAALSIESLSKRPGWANLDAVRNRKIALLDGDIVSRPGPRFVDAMELVAAALYPELF